MSGLGNKKQQLEYGVCMSKLSRTALAAGGLFLSLALAAIPSATGAKKNSIEDLAGRWSGVGNVQWRSGRQEPYSGVVTYYLRNGGQNLKQLLRCKDQVASENKIDLSTALLVAGDNLTGTWEDRLYSLSGTVSGKVTATGFEANATNSMFKARLEIEMAGACDQLVTIRPSRDIEVITAQLKKC